MTKNEILQKIKDHTGVTYGAAVFNIAKIYTQENKLSTDSNQITWDVVLEVINRDSRRFMTWLVRDAPEKFKEIAEVEPAAAAEREEVLAVTRLNAIERKRLEDLNKLKQSMDIAHKRGESLTLTEILQKMGFTAFDIQALKQLKVYTKHRHPTDHLKYSYQWIGDKPSSKMVIELDKLARENRAHYAKENKRKKRELAQKKADELRRQQELRRAERIAMRQKRMRKIVTQGSVVDKSEVDFINTLKAHADGITEETLFSEPEESKPVTASKPSTSIQKLATQVGIPIEVSVTTEGAKKTVSISIEV